ncbi:NADP-dependent oxidoreductase domain-containing protein [Mariannaea sp. PMI_226]|nr:NADP-dependent oxidoreductase domain-containing protein [Mariannaea sp. PMI_226]
MAAPNSPRVILGLMTHGPASIPDARVTSIDEFQRQLDAFQNEFGGTEIDTARIYLGGEQESFTAQAGWKERGVQIATKSYPLAPGGHTAANLRKDLETSLAKLGTDCVDIFYLHSADRSVPYAETLEAANALYTEGKFRKLGLSNFSAYEIAEIVMLCDARGWVKPTIYQGIYNALTRNLETEVIPACRRFGLDLVVFNALAGGLLTGRFLGSATSDEVGQGRYDTKTFLGPIYRSMYFKDSTFEAVKMINAVAEKHSLSMTEVAFRWCVHHSALKTALQGGNDGILIGISKIEQIGGNMKDIRKGPLPEDVVEVLEKAWLMVKGTSPNPWHTPLVYTYEGYSKP